MVAASDSSKLLKASASSWRSGNVKEQLDTTVAIAGWARLLRLAVRTDPGDHRMSKSLSEMTNRQP